MAESQKAIVALGRTVYNQFYNKGWRHAQTANASLDNQPFGRWRGWAWEDGYLDYAGDRPKWHRRDCELDDHNECPTL